MEASLEVLRPEVEAALAAVHPQGAVPQDDVAQAEARLDAAVAVMHRLALANEPLLRTMIRLTAGRTSHARRCEAIAGLNGSRLQWRQSGRASAGRASNVWCQR